MESLQDQRVIQFHPDTMSFIRSQYNLDRPGEMDRAVDVLENWLKKQNHFTVKNFPRDFLERQIILDKGSVERAKNQMEKLFTMKTIVTSIIGQYDAKKDFDGLRDVYIQTLMPKLTPDHYRIYAAKPLSDGFDTKLLTKCYIMAANIIEYIRAFDYTNGYVAIFDYRDINVLELLSQLNLTELRQLIGYIMEGYQMRLKGLHFITTSKAMDVLVKILKQMFSAKIGQRIHVHLTLESLHAQVPKDCLPAELGGEQKSLFTLCDEFIDELARPENVEYFREMGKAVVDESLRVGDKTSKDDLLGITGSFRTITVD